MIVGIGLDLVATARMERALRGDERGLVERVFTPAERTACAERADPAQAFAARFAAKEACFKALGTGWAEGVSFQQVEVVGLEGGRPELRLTGPAAERAKALGVQRALVTLSHEREIAAAVVVLEG